MLSDDDIRILFDVATNSLDFGSGFLDNEEVEALRRVAVYLGVDPKEATPDNFTNTYYPPPPRVLTPQERAAQAGHFGVNFAMDDALLRVERYTCNCGWTGRMAAYDAHLVAMAAAQP